MRGALKAVIFPTVAPAAGPNNGNLTDSVGTDHAVSSSALTTYTFSAKALGTAKDNRYIIVVCAYSNGSSARSLSSATIGGVSASRLAGSAAEPAQRATFLIGALVPTGTTGDIVITMDGACAGMQIAVFAVYAISSLTPTATTQATTSNGSGVVTLSVNTLNSSVVIAGMSCTNTTQTNTWAGATEYSDEANSTTMMSSAILIETTGATPRTITDTGSAGTTLTNPRGISAVFQ